MMDEQDIFNLGSKDVETAYKIADMVQSTLNEMNFKETIHYLLYQDACLHISMRKLLHQMEELINDNEKNLLQRSDEHSEQ